MTILSGSSDPYIVMYTPDMKNKLWKSKTKKKTCNPSWQLEQYITQVPYTENLHVIIFDYDKFGKDEFMGAVKLQPSIIHLIQEEVESDIVSIIFDQVSGINPKSGTSHTVSGSFILTLSVNPPETKETKSKKVHAYTVE
mmetsp:Transcript_23908/g.26529  ORF Transcript_23908/g.26529 Transcript_23908/m.26529 type:complete len:140 (-) Transcript_23908:124-543(-)